MLFIAVHDDDEDDDEDDEDDRMMSEKVIMFKAIHTYML